MDTDASGVPRDPYRVLQLRAGAPRYLVEETYWLLVARVRRTSSSGAIAVERVDELTNAYHGIVRADGDGRPPRAASRARRRAQQWWRRRTGAQAAPPPEDLYAALHLDPAADDDVVRLAARLVSGAGTGRQGGGARRHAAEVLTDAHRRARYDAHPDEEGAPPATDLPLEGSGQLLDDTPGEERNEYEPREPDEREARRVEGEDAATGALSVARARLAGRLPRLTGRPDRSTLVEAENRRLLGLKEGAVPPSAHGSGAPVVVIRDAPGTPSAGGDVLAAALSVVSGPRAGEEIPVEPVEGAQVVLKDQRGGVKLRVWHLSGRWLLQQLDGPPVSIGGRPLEAPIVILEDGDEIDHGGSVLRFTAARAAEPSVETPRA